MGYPIDRMTLIYNSSSAPPAASESDPKLLENLASQLPSAASGRS
jgi:hypothetical protein